MARRRLIAVALLLLAPLLPAGCRSDANDPANGAPAAGLPGNSGAGGAPDFAGLLIGPWDCSNQNGDNRAVGKVKYHPDGTATGRFTSSGFSNDRHVELEISVEATWSLEKDQVWQAVTHAEVTDLKIDGHSLPERLRPKAAPKHVFENARIERLDERALVLVYPSKRVECWRGQGEAAR